MILRTKHRVWLDANIKPYGYESSVIPRIGEIVLHPFTGALMEVTMLEYHVTIKFLIRWITVFVDLKEIGIEDCTKEDLEEDLSMFPIYQSEC